MFTKSSIFKVVVFLIVLLGYLLVFKQFETIEVEANTNSKSSFDASRAFDDLSNLLLTDGSEHPHPVDSIANYQVAERLISAMRSLGYQEEFQQQEFCIDHKNGSAKCAQIKNIIFRLNGSFHSENKKSKRAILLSAHYDSVNAAPGASDAGTAVATLIEIARLLSLQPQPINDVIFLFNDGEEAGLLGARAFMKSHPYAKEIQWVLNLDAIGSSGRSLMIETGEKSGELIDVFSEISKNKASRLPGISAQSKTPIANSFISFLWENMPSDTDMTIFKQYGLSGLNFINLEGSAHYHTPLDNLANVDKGSLQEHGGHLWALLSVLKDKPIIDNHSVDNNSVDSYFSDQPIYQEVMGYGIVHWNQSVGIGVSILVLLLLVWLLSFFRYEIYQFWQAMIKTIASVVFILGASVVTAVILKKGIQFVSFHLSGSSEPWFTQFLPMQFYMVTGIFVVSFICLEFIKNSICYPLLIILMSLFFSIVALLSSIFVPEISAMFVITSVLSLLILMPVFIRRFRNSFISEKHYYQLSGLLITIVTIYILVPNLYLLEVMMTFYWTPVIGFIIGITFISSMSLAFSGEKSSSLVDKNQKSLKTYISQLNFTNFDKLTMLLLFSGVCIWVLATPIYTAETPNSLNFQYLQIDSTNEKQSAYILAGGKLEKISESLKLEFQKSSNFKLKKVKPWSSSRYISATTESLEIKPIAINILSDTKANDSRTVKLQFDSGVNDVNEIKIFIPIESKLKSISTGTNLIAYKDDDLKNRTHYGFHCIGISCGRLVLDLETPFDKSLSLNIIETRKGLPIELEHLIKLKGDKFVEKGKGDRQIISQTIKF